MVVNVVMTTYFTPEVPAREQYAKQSVESLIANLVCEDRRKLIVADDSSNDYDGLVPHDLIVAAWKGSFITRSGHKGIGASLNLALSHIPDEDFWVYTTDDWVLVHPLNLDGPLKLLTRLGYDLVRLGPIHPDLQCVTRFNQGIGWWLDLLPAYGGFAFATRPFIATKNFVNKIGPFDEGLNSYETERKYAERVAHSTCKLAYWGAVNLAGPWSHIGIENVGYRDI